MLVGAYLAAAGKLAIHLGLGRGTAAAASAAGCALGSAYSQEAFAMGVVDACVMNLDVAPPSCNDPRQALLVHP